MTEKEEKQGKGRRYPSLVWPIVLIAAGVGVGRAARARHSLVPGADPAPAFGAGSW